jgi:hypothetical protein
MAKQRMSIDELVRARDRAAAMFSNFGDEESAEEFANMTPEEYADHKGIEIVSANPPTTPRSRGLTERKHIIVANKSQLTVELEDTLSDIYDVVQESGSTRASMQDALEQIADLCTDAVPDLEGSESEDESESEDLGNEEEQ